MADPRLALAVRRDVADLRQEVGVLAGATVTTREAVIRDARLNEVLASGDESIAQGAVVRFRVFIVRRFDGYDGATAVYDTDGLNWDIYSIRESSDGRFLELMTKRVSVAPPPTEQSEAPPRTPVGLRVENGDGQFTLHWHPPFGGDVRITSYEISIDLGRTWVRIVEVDPDARVTNFSFVMDGQNPTGLVPVNGDRYPVALRAIATVQRGAEREEIPSVISAVVYGLPRESPPPPPLATVPSAPGAPTLEVQGSTQIRVTWDAPDDGGAEITHYDVRYRAGSGQFINQNDLPAEGLSLLLGGLSGSTRYEVQVQAANEVGDSGFGRSAVARTTTAATVPSAPAQPTISLLAATSLRVSWREPNSGGSTITGYRLRYRQSGGSYRFLSFGATTFNTTIRALTPDRTYEVSVRASNGIGNGDYSPAATATTPRESTVPSQPARPTLAVIDHQTIRVTWVAPDDGGSAITGYTIQHRRSSSGFSATRVEATALSLLLSNLEPSTSYVVRVIATNGLGDSSPSATTTASTPAAPIVATVPGQVSRPSLTNITYNSLRVNWVAPTTGGAPIIGYEIEVNPSGQQIYTRAVSGTARSVVLTGLGSDRSHSVRVRARNEVGFGRWSPSQATTTLPPPPPAPSVDGVTAFNPTTTIQQFRVPWTVPSAQFGTGFTLQFQVSTTETFSTVVLDSTWSLPHNRQPIITGDVARRAYYVRARIHSSLGTSAWASRFVERP